MSETLIGVMIGGIIASITPIVTLFFERKKWRKSVRLDHLRSKRSKLENDFKEAADKLSKGMEKNLYFSEMFADFEVIFPENVRDAFMKFLQDKDSHKDITKIKFYFATITREMKKSLSDIDVKIEKEIN